MVVYAYMYKVFFTPNVQNKTHFRHLLFEQTHSSGIFFNHWSYLTYVVMYCTYNTGHSHLFILFFFWRKGEPRGWERENGRPEVKECRMQMRICTIHQIINFFLQATRIRTYQKRLFSAGAFMVIDWKYLHTYDTKAQPGLRGKKKGHRVCTWSRLFIYSNEESPLNLIFNSNYLHDFTTSPPPPRPLSFFSSRFFCFLFLKLICI